MFVYGSLLDARLLARRAGAPRLILGVRPALLAGYLRAGRRHSRYRPRRRPTLRRDPGHVVTGVLVHMAADALCRLSAWEGPRYRLRHLSVGTPRGPIRAGV